MLVPGAKPGTLPCRYQGNQQLMWPPAHAALVMAHGPGSCWP